MPEVAQLDWPHAKLLIEVEPNKQAGPLATYRANAFRKEPWQQPYIEGMAPGGPANGGSVFYDIGANVGSYALAAASRGVMTVAIEPGFSNYAALCRNALMNKLLPRIIALPVALAGETGLSWFDYQDVRAGAASHVLGSSAPVYFSTHRQMVQVYALDDLIATFKLPHPTHIKIDVDGNGDVELALIAGMAGVLADERTQALMVECPLETEAQIVETLAKSGWHMAERFDTRDGQRIQGICYGLFKRELPEP